MTRTNLVSSSIGFTAMLGAAALYNGGESTWWLYVYTVCLVIWAWTIRVKSPKSVPRNLLSLVLAAEAIWLIALTFLSQIPALSWAQALVLGSVPLAYFVGCAASDDAHHILMAEQILGLLAVAILGFGIFELIALRFRPFSTFLDSNVLAAYANIFFFVTYPRVIGVWSTHGPKAALFSRTAAFACLALVAGFSTTSLGGFLCFTGGLALITIIGARQSITFVKAAALASVVAAISYFSVYAIQDRPSPLSRISAEASSGGHASDEQGTFMRERMALYTSAVQIIRDQPWYGAGPGLFIALYPKYRSAEDRSTAGALVHNDYLQFLLEGGPILLICVLATLACVVRALYGNAREFWRIDLSSDVEALRRLGIQVALITLFVHAFPNFIFYSLTMSLLAGLLLSQIDAPGGAKLDISHILTPLSSMAIATLAVILLTVTIGLQGALVKIENGECPFRGCESLQINHQKLMPLASLLIAVQPSWVHGTDFLVEQHLDLANSARSPVEKWTHILRAVQISSDAVRRFPTIYTQYSVLASIIEHHLGVAEQVAEGVPRNPIELYSKAVAWNPMHIFARARLAVLQARQGDENKAWQTVYEGTRWWKNSVVSDIDRRLLLTIALPLAIRTHHCTDASEMADGLLLLDQSNLLAKQIVSRNAGDRSVDLKGKTCGLEFSPGLPT